MAMIKCPECGKEVSDKAKTCPNCGVKVGHETGRTRNTVEKVLTIIGIAIVVLFLIGKAYDEIHVTDAEVTEILNNAYPSSED